jgi:hypothetical protein
MPSVSTNQELILQCTELVVRDCFLSQRNRVSLWALLASKLRLLLSSQYKLLVLEGGSLSDHEVRTTRMICEWAIKVRGDDLLPSDLTDSFIAVLGPGSSRRILDVVFGAGNQLLSGVPFFFVGTAPEHSSIAESPRFVNSIRHSACFAMTVRVIFQFEVATAHRFDVTHFEITEGS